MENRPETRLLQDRIICVPGGRDKDGRPIILITIPSDSPPLEITTCLQYVLTLYSEETKFQGLTIILDARKGPWKIARSCIRQISTTMNKDVLAHFIVIRPENFLDKQRVENCTNTPKDGQVLFMPRSRLNKLVDQCQLPIDLNGSFIYNHDLWIENRMKVDEYLQDSSRILKNLNDLHQHLLKGQLMRPSEVESTLNNSTDLIDTMKIMTYDTLERGRLLLEKIELDNRNRKFISESESMLTPQDILDTIEQLENFNVEIRNKQSDIETAWKAMERNFLNTKDLSILGDGIVRVINWILGPAENLLNSKQKVGYDVASAEELRREHEAIELQCWDTYGAYAELLHKVESFAKDESLTLQQKDLISQKDFMDFVCRSFATRLERRRNVLITSLRFFRLVSEYFDRTGEVFDSLVMGNKIGDFSAAGFQLKQLQENQTLLDNVERELIKEGEKLSDMLSMPVKDALGRELTVDYSEDIVNVRDILDATIARKNIFSDSVDLQKLTLEQVTHIYEYEKDAAQAIQWLDDLFYVLLKDHGHVGITVYEIQSQKDEHQSFQDTAKDTYNYGVQLLNASFSLRQSCKLPIDDHNELQQRLKFSWQRLLKVSQEQMTRLRVSAVFHRSIDEHCNQLRDLREAVATIPLMEISIRRSKVRQYFGVREKLMVEVGRMVRLGRLLRSRLRELLYFNDGMSDTGLKETDRDSESTDQEETGSNATAIDAISEKLTEVTNLSEELDQTLRNAQQDCAILTTAATSTTVTNTIPINIITSTKYTSEKPPMISEDLVSKHLKPEELKSDEEFQTASECTLQHSRSSSYNTASECNEQINQYAPWWEYGKEDVHEDISKEKMVLAVGLPDLPQAKAVLKPSPEVPPGKIVREVTETTHYKVQQLHSMGVQSFVLTSETVRDKKNEVAIKMDDGSKKEDVKVGDDGERIGENGKVDEDLERRMGECGDWMQLKILEITPELTTLGNTLEEALELQTAHNEVLKQLQNKQSPVEELLRQADQLISTQKPRAEVYAAMAESLGRAWKDINFHLELRKQILDLNVQYHQRAKEFFDNVKELDVLCSEENFPIDIETVKNFLTKIHDQRRTILEALMAAMHTGNTLIAKLKELGAQGTLDSRPERIRIPVATAISQVQGWMDELHSKRQIIELTFTKRKEQLEQCLALGVLAADMKDLEEKIRDRREILINTDQLGDSASSAELLKLENQRFLPEAQQFQEKALKITKATEKLVSTGCFAGEEATKQAYVVLSTTSDYLSDLQQRDSLLDKVIAFFRSAQAALNKLDQIEIQLTATELKKTSPELAKLHAQCSILIDQITSAPLSEGHSILQLYGRMAGTEGVNRMVEELENKKIHLDGICIQHREENRRINEALNNFFEQQSTIYKWLIEIAEAFLQGHQNMGVDLSLAKDFLYLHNQLLNDLQTKGNEINALLLTLPPLLEFLDDNQRQEVDQKVEALHNRWIKLKNVLEKRLDLATIFVKFHEEADIVTQEMDKLEGFVQKSGRDISDDQFRILEERWESLVPLYQSAKNTGLTFISEASKVSEPYLDVKQACGSVESVLEKLKNRQLVVTRSWQTFQTEVVERKELITKWEEHIMESTKTINWVSKLDSQLYPVITTNATNPKDISNHVEKKLETVLPEIKRAQCEVEQRIRTTEALMARGPSIDERSLNVKNKLTEMSMKLTEITTNYQSLLEKMVKYFNNLSEVDRIVGNLNTRQNKIGLPGNINELELTIREHEDTKHTIIEMFKLAQTDCDQLIKTITVQEPRSAADLDISKLQHTVRLRQDNWEREWSSRRDELEGHRQICQFDSDLQQINTTIDDISRKLEIVKGQYGESLNAANNILLNFDYFERTINELEPLIDNFVKRGEQMLRDQHVHSPRIKHHIQDLQERWHSLKHQIIDTRNLIELSIKYFKLVDEADEWFKEGSRLLMSITRRATTVKKPEEAQRLLNEIETFLKPGESKQNERIRNITKLASELFCQDKVAQVSDVMVQNTGMMDSFSLIREELNALALNLKSVEEQREKARKEQEEANAKLEAAKAEAAAAHAAATAAEEARKAAEEAAKLLRESTVTHKHTVEVREIPIVKEVNTVEIVEVKEEPKMIPPKFVSPLSDVVIEEGSKFSFICHVTGVPTPVVTWYKGGMSIQNLPDYETTFDQGLCTLTIEETFADDSAKYTCKAINAVGSAETSAILLVKETQAEEQLSPPTFVKYLQPAIMKEGEPFQFECKVEGNPLPTVQWYKNSDCIDNSPDYIITYNNGEAILKFDHVYLSDKADYICKAVNDLGVAQCSATLNVIPLEPTESPTFISPLSNVMARAGQKIKLECEVTGIPPPTLTWTHNGKTVRETRELKLLQDSNKATLLVNEAFPKDAGTYVVTAYNIAGEVTSSCTVSVKGRLPTETSDSELASDMEPVKPLIQVPLRNITTDEGKTVHLDCVIVGQPEPEVIWYHNDRPVKESSDFQLLFKGDRCTLVIQLALPEDGGEYKVVARNSAGEASSKCTLMVNPTEDKKPGVPPKFSKLLTDVLISEGDKVVLEAAVSGEPKPEIKWILNNQPIQASEHVKITEDEQGNLKLEIDKVLPEDRGVYTVKATNPSGDAKCFAQLIVKSSKPTEVKVHEEVKLAPSFKETFHDRTIFEKTTTKFECIATGKPTPKFKWLFNDKPVSGENFLISTSGDRQVLTIRDAEKQNEGKITCIAENDAGRAILSAQLVVQKVADVTLPDGQLELIVPTTTLQQQQQFSESSYNVKREVFMQSSSSHTSKTISSSSTSSTTGPKVEEHKIVSEKEHVYKQEDQKPPEIYETHKVEEYRQFGKEPTVQEKQSRFVSTSGQETKTIIHKPVIKSRPPRFITPVDGKIVDQGSDVVFEGTLDGHPIPEVTWTKNGIPLSGGEGIKISFESNHARLEIKNVNSNDAGQYSCSAVNEAGKAVCTSDLVVRKTVFPPVFGHRLQAQVIKKGDRITMNIEVTGTPEPTVSWYKDGLPIQDSMKEGYKIKSIGNCHTLTIEKADLSHTGKYMVRAVNAGGEAQSIADTAVFEPTPDTMVEVVKTVVFEDVRKHETLTTASDKSTKTVSEKEQISQVTAKPLPKTVPDFKPIPISKPVPFETPKQTEVKREVEVFKTETPSSKESTMKSSESEFKSSRTEFSSVTEQTMKQESKTMKVERTTTPVSFMVTKKEKTVEEEREIPVTLKKETTYEIIGEPKEIKTQQISEDQGIETSSITKKQSLDFFVKKMKETEEPPKPKELPKVAPIREEMYTKFEEISKTEPPKQSQEKEKPFTIPKPSEPAFTSHTSHSSSSHSYQQYSTFSSGKDIVHEEIKLIPEPPPEICYPTTQRKEEIIEKSKKLEESYKEIAAAEIPSPKKDVKIPPVFETKSSIKEIYKAESSVPIYRPATEALEMEKLWSTQKIVEEKQQTTKPVPTPEPVVDALSMEKTWAHKSETKSHSQVWPPVTVEQPKPISTPTWSSQSTLEKRWAPSTQQETKTITEEAIQKSFEKKIIPAKSEKFVQETKTTSYDKYVPHYIAEVTHEHKVNEQQLSQMSKISERKETIFQESGTKASDIIKSWPLKQVEEPIKPLIDRLPIRPVSVQDITDEVYLEPGPPPEIGYAQSPIIERRVSYVETREHEIEKELEKGPTKVLPGAVRTVPPPLPPKKLVSQAPPLPAKPKKVIETPFERFPDLEPFPFKPDPEKPKPVRLAPPPTPSKFIKGKFTDSDYESDVDAVRIPVKWRPYVSDTEEPTYRRVQAPKITPIQRSRSIEKEAIPPSQFESPARLEGPPRPTIDFESVKELRKEKKQIKHFTKHVQDVRKEIPKPISPPDIKPGSPPEFVQTEPIRPKPTSPKTKQKAFVVDGYMADTDEPFTLRYKKSVKTEKQEEREEIKQQYDSKTVMETQSFITSKPSPKITQHKRHVQSSTSVKKELVPTPIITTVSTSEEIIQHGSKEQVLEPFPYKPDPARQRRSRAPPPPSPSKFIKGEFRESDYESEYEGRIAPIWRPSSTEPDPTYRPVKPALTPTGRTSHGRERTPTPPSQFDVPPQPGAMRPKFEPIEKPMKSVKLEEIVKPIPKPAAFKPQPKQEIVDVIIATPAAPERILQPGTPPEIAYAPGPQKTQYYRSTTSMPYQNAVQTETSNVMHFNESTEHSHRTMSVQQTTRVIKFGDQQKYKGTPPPKPTKFVPGEFRESDYESEVESTKIKAKWTPGGSDTEDLHYRKVKAPLTRALTAPSPHERVYSPMEYDDVTKSSSTESKSIMEISKKFGETKSESRNQFNSIQPGTPPEYGYVPDKITKTSANKIASQHMDSMTQSFKSKTQKFVSDIVSDMKQKPVQKPILKPSDETDAQVYREESRAAQYGTKHYDPDTGLIYFKYDFGYEFGIILPGEGKNGVGHIPTPKKTVIEPPKRAHDIEMPVIHETSQKDGKSSFKPKKFMPSSKNVKWEPTSESEMSEYEGEMKRKQLDVGGNRWEQSSCSPISISPSLPSTSPAFNNYGQAQFKGTETPPSCPSTPGTTPSQQVNKRAPMFITPLRDIAVVSGQLARFECIVQSEPPPTILWSKNARIIESSSDHQIFYRNGVCRLTIPQAFPEDAGTYTCTATNHVGSVTTTATLQVPGELRSAYLK